MPRNHDGRKVCVVTSRGLIDTMGSRILIVSSALSLSALLALCLVRKEPAAS
jgi:hypothetical protein